MKQLCSFLTERRYLKSFLSFLLIVMSSSITAQTLSDWQYVENKEGCASIPYSDLKDDCDDNRSANASYCKDDNANWNGKDPKTLQSDVDGMKTRIENVKQKKNELDRERSSATEESKKNELTTKMKECDDEISMLERKIDEWKSRIDNEKQAISRALSDAERCLEVRQDTYKIFDLAIQKAKNESDPDIKKIAEKLINQWQKGQDGHKVAVENMKNRISNLKQIAN